MKMLSIAATLTVLAAIVLTRAVGADGPSRPPGVGATDWIPISDTLGIVLAQSIPPAGDVLAPLPPDQRNPRTPASGFGGGAVLVPPTNGYFMVKRGARWGRLVIIEPLKGPGDTG
jgi:hypothetical protein